MTGRLENAGVFSVAIGLSGEPDAPPPLIFGSSPAVATPGHSFVAITQETYRGLLAALEASGTVLSPGRAVVDEPGYYVNVEADGQGFGAWLGHDRTTLATLARMRDALPAADRSGIEPHIRRLEQVLAR